MQAPAKPYAAGVCRLPRKATAPFLHPKPNIFSVRLMGMTAIEFVVEKLARLRTPIV